MTDQRLSTKSPTILAALMIAALSAMTAQGADVYAPRPVDEVRSEVTHFLSRHGVKDEKTLSRIAEVWAPGVTVAAGRDVFDRLIQTFCLADSNTKRFVEACSPAVPVKGFPKQSFLSADLSEEFYTVNVRLFYACRLTQRTMYDEAMTEFNRIDPSRVVDPATCLFYKAVCQHQLLLKKPALETLDKLLHKTEGVAESYLRVGELMRDELASLDDESLTNVSRKMQDSERRLDLGRGGQRVQKVQEEIVESLDEIIKKKEDQANQQAQAGQGENNSNRSNGPAEDSGIKGATGPGNVDKKNLKKQGSWGALPQKQIDAAQNLLNKEFPSNYHRAVEEYFKKLANRPAAKGQ